MVRVNGNIFRNRFGGSKVPFNAVTDVRLSDAVPATGGGAQILNDTTQGATYQSDDLIGALIYLLFLDGIQFTQVTTFSDPAKKEFKFYPQDDEDAGQDAGTVVFAYNIDDPVQLTIFYSSPGTVGAPAAEPVTLAEAKAYMKIDTGTADDDLITELITTARQQCEDYSGISIVNRTVTAVLNNSCGGIYLPYGPVISITSVVNQDDEDALTTDDYTLSGLDFPQLIEPWSDKITLIYTAGYGIPPKRIKTAILQQVFYLYQNRGEVDVDLTLSPQCKSTLSRIRRVG